MEQVSVGRVGRPHGVRGEVTVEVRTDEPGQRFRRGARLSAVAPRPGAPVPSELTVAGSRWHQGRLLLEFEEVGDRDAAEVLRDVVLMVEVDPQLRPEDPDEFYDHQLTGLAAVVDSTDERIGEVTEVLHSGAQDLLVVRRDDGREVLVPFVSALVPQVDLVAGRVLVVDQPGLLDPEE